MAAEQTISWRYERKFLLQDLSLPQAQSILRLHPALFSPLYHPRWVNNIYFDDRDMGSFRDNVDGTAQRTKVRIRWYGELFGAIDAPTLELKIKQGLLGRKESLRLAPFRFDRGFERRTLTQLLASAPDVPDPMKAALRDGLPVLVNRYRRSYLRSADGRFRVTLDGSQRFLPIRVLGNTFLPRWTNDGDVILELKYDEAHDDDAAKIVNRFPFRLTKSSKYVSGLLATRG